jgi:3-oxoacyl-[acyl-carrier protein] reductase
MSNSVAIVTGASSGIGKATALRLARDFGAIVLAARSGEPFVNKILFSCAVGAKQSAPALEIRLDAFQLKWGQMTGTKN